MALTADIALNPTTFGGANVSKTYSLLGYSGTSEALRRVAATVNTTPETLAIKHREVKVNGAKTAQHLVRLDKVLTDVLLGPVQLSARLVVEVPMGTTIVTNQEILDIVGRLIALEQGVGVFDKLMNWEA